MYSLDFLILVSHSKEVPTALKIHNIACLTLNSLLANDLRKLQNNPKVVCIITGIGFKNTQLALNWIRQNISCKLFINLGSAGSSNSNYLHKLVCPQQFICNKKSYLGLGLFPFLLNNTSILTVSNCESVQQLNLNSSSAVIDMESFWQAEFCHRHNIYYCSLKFITDMNNLSTKSSYLKSLTFLQDQFNSIINEILTPIKDSVSVIIPTYNRAKFLIRSIDSVLNQTHQAHCIVVNDGSTDETQTILTSYKSKIDVIRLDQNKGVSYARNIGISHANSNWMSFLDSDDQWHSNKLKNQLDFYKHHPYFSILQSQENWIRDNKKVNKKKQFNKASGFIWDICLNRCMISPSSVLIKKDIFDKFNLFDESLPVCEDYDLWLRLSRFLLVGLEDSFSLNKFAGHENQLSTSFEVMDRFRLSALKKALKNETHPDFITKLQDIINFKKTIITNGKLKRGKNSILSK